MSGMVWNCIGSPMRPWLLSAVVPLYMLSVGNPAVAQERGGVRFDGVGSGITHAPGDKPSTFLAEAGNRDRSVRPGATTDQPRQQQAPGHRGSGSFDYRGLRMTPPGLEPIGRDSVPTGGANILPRDLSSMPQYTEKSNLSGRPSPKISIRDGGGVLGLSYKIQPAP
ncbi:hypothetical protein [Reyranella sp. CPCC 100927]|uniref:hypothetical protein n=1 Tax=Reyranella sp. CPCC 100927 TaxID=2599616 RepID=UPI0011B5C6A3|nr:hypothetical protein [Reyranella sp. CPCC 100927]TWT10117.1 hypothetical protein FQU96_18685 [Reyranella sp. CPCC 100927]